MLRLNSYAVTTALAIAMMGCASTPKTNSAVEDARNTIHQVERLPLAGEVAAKSIEDAHTALRQAEELTAQKKSQQDITNAAYIAKRHAEIAREQISQAEAKRTVEKAEAQRQAVLLEARGREAAAKGREAEMSKEEAAAAKEQAEAANKRAEELQKQLEALNAKPTERGFVLTLGDVLFDTGKATLKPGAMSVIDRLSAFLKDADDRKVVIEGHTDSVGSEELNMSLSQRRADAVREALLSRGVVGERIAAVGKGESYPIAGNESAGGRQQNRRVEIVIENAEKRSAQINR